MPQKSKRPMRISKQIQAKLRTAKLQDWRKKRCKMQNGRCAYCGDEIVVEAKQSSQLKKVATLDHVIPLSRGGEDHFENSVAACKSCNHEKKDMTSDEYIMFRLKNNKKVLST